MKFTIEQVEAAYKARATVWFYHKTSGTIYNSHMNDSGLVQVCWTDDEDVKSVTYTLTTSLQAIGRGDWVITEIVNNPTEDASNWHPHHDLIVAWAKGAKIQVDSHGVWVDVDECSWNKDRQYRIKPVPVKKWKWVIHGSVGYEVTSNLYASPEEYYAKYQNSTLKFIQKIDESEQEF